MVKGRTGGGGVSRSEKMVEARVAVVKEHSQMKVGFFSLRFFLRDFWIADVAEDHAPMKVRERCLNVFSGFRLCASVYMTQIPLGINKEDEIVSLCFRIRTCMYISRVLCPTRMCCLCTYENVYVRMRTCVYV